MKLLLTSTAFSDVQVATQFTTVNIIKKENNMNMLKRVLVFGTALFSTFCFFCQVGMAAGDVSAGRGRITEINIAENYLAVDVPIGNNELMTVAGSLSAEAVLKKGSIYCSLKEFKVNDQVSITWRRTDDGLVMESLRGTAFPAADFSTSTGRVTEIEAAQSFIAVDVPIGHKEFMTVAGQLAPKAVLKKGGKICTLNSYKVNDQVSITWRRRDDGLVIEALQGK